MARSVPKLVLNPSRDIPFDKLVLSQANVRKVKCGVSIPDLAKDIAHRTLLQSLNVRTMVDEDGNETGMFEVPAGGRRYLALELLVKEKTLAKTAPIPCIVKAANDPILAEEDSYAENTFREPLHPLDQFRGMQKMVDSGQDVESIAAHFLVTPAVVNQRLKLAKVSPKLHEIYAEDGMTLEQLMAFAVADDHERQEQLWEQLEHGYNKSPAYIRQKLTENTVKASDKRVRFVGIDAYVAAGGSVMRDLFQQDDGGWLTDPALLDKLVDEKLVAEGERIGAEGWKWIATAVDLPWGVTHGLREIDGVETPMTAEEEAQLAELQDEADDLEAEWSDADEIPDAVNARIVAIDEQIGALTDRPVTFDPDDIARAGVFISIEGDGSLCIERGYVRPEDEPAIEVASGDDADGNGGSQDRDTDRSETVPVAGSNVVSITSAHDEDDDADGEVVKPLPDRLVAELTAWRTLALQDAFAQSPTTAFAAVLHAFVLAAFYPYGQGSCIELSLSRVSFGMAPTGLKDSAPAKAIAERHARWKARLPQSDQELWDALLMFDANEQATLFAHCASLAVNAQQEVVPKYDNGRVSRRAIERRIDQSHVLARAVGLDVVGAGWRPTAAGYFGSVTKPRILADVAEAKGAKFAEMIDHLKKGDMAREAERLMEDAGWLPEPMRTPDLGEQLVLDPEGCAEGLPAFLDEDGISAANDESDHAVAA